MYTYDASAAMGLAHVTVWPLMTKYGLSRPLVTKYGFPQVARLALPNIPSVQTSWTKMGARGAAMALRAGANDLGGTLMNEHISRAAGASHGQEMDPDGMRALVARLPPDADGARRFTWQRTTTYGVAERERVVAADNAPALTPI